MVASSGVTVSGAGTIISPFEVHVSAYPTTVPRFFKQANFDQILTGGGVHILTFEDWGSATGSFTTYTAAVAGWHLSMFSFDAFPRTGANGTNVVNLLLNGTTAIASATVTVNPGSLPPSRRFITRLAYLQIGNTLQIQSNPTTDQSFFEASLWGVRWVSG